MISSHQHLLSKGKSQLGKEDQLKRKSQLGKEDQLKRKSQLGKEDQLKRKSHVGKEDQLKTKNNFFPTLHFTTFRNNFKKISIKIIFIEKV